MPTAFHPWSVHLLPTAATFGTDTQLPLVMNHEDVPEAVHTLVTLEQRNYLGRLARYSCDHDFLVKLKYPGRRHNNTFSEFVTNYRFEMYVVPPSNSGRATLWVRTKDQVARDFINRLNRHRASDFQAVERVVDFAALRQRQEIISGAWFSEMRAPNISSAGVFGNRVDRSEEFQRAEQQGRLKTLSFPYESATSRSLINVTQAGCVVTSAHFETPEEELALVLHFKENVLDYCWSM